MFIMFLLSQIVIIYFLIVFTVDTYISNTTRHDESKLEIWTLLRSGIDGLSCIK